MLNSRRKFLSDAWFDGGWLADDWFSSPSQISVGGGDIGGSIGISYGFGGGTSTVAGMAAERHREQKRRREMNTIMTILLASQTQDFEFVWRR